MSVPFTEAEWRAYISYYNHMVAKMDRELGTVLGTINELSLWPDTAFVLTGDHGDMYGAHGLGFKGPVMYDEVTRVPLLIGWQGVLPQAESRDQLCHNGDIYPTVCELAGIHPPDGIDGKSLFPCFEVKEAVIHQSVMIEYYGNAKATGACPIRCIVNERYKYVRYLNGDEELYDLQTDRDELCNLIRDPSNTIVSAEMRNTLARYVNDTGDELFRTAVTHA
jgi:arylsulfatase A-like enzyme